jgi:hypothetical protein
MRGHESWPACKVCRSVNFRATLIDEGSTSPDGVNLLDTRNDAPVHAGQTGSNIDEPSILCEINSSFLAEFLAFR